MAESWYTYKNLSIPPIIGENVVNKLNEIDPNIFQAGMNFLIRIDKSLCDELICDENDEERKKVILAVNNDYSNMRSHVGDLSFIDGFTQIFRSFRVIYIKLDQLLAKRRSES